MKEHRFMHRSMTREEARNKRRRDNPLQSSVNRSAPDLLNKTQKQTGVRTGLAAGTAGADRRVKLAKTKVVTPIFTPVNTGRPNRSSQDSAARTLEAGRRERELLAGQQRRNTTQEFVLDTNLKDLVKNFGIMGPAGSGTAETVRRHTRTLEETLGTTKASAVISQALIDSGVDPKDAGAFLKTDKLFRGNQAPPTGTAIAKSSEEAQGILDEADEARGEAGQFESPQAGAGGRPGALGFNPEAGQFESPQAGAGGRPGALGFNPESEKSNITKGRATSASLRKEAERLRTKPTGDVRDASQSHFVEKFIIENFEVRRRADEMDKQADEMDQRARDRVEEAGKTGQGFTGSEEDVATGQDSQPNKIQEKTNTVQTKADSIDTSKTRLDLELMRRMANVSGMMDQATTGILNRYLAQTDNIDQDINDARSLVPDLFDVKEDARLAEEDLDERIEKVDLARERLLQIQLDVAGTSKALLELERTRFEIGQKASIAQQLDINIQNEERNRRILNRLGGSGSGNGLKFMRSENQKGIRELNLMQNNLQLGMESYTLKIVDGWSNQVNSALANHDLKSLELEAIYSKERQQILDTVSKSRSERNKELSDLDKDRARRHDENFKNTGTALKEASFKRATLLSEKENALWQDRENMGNQWLSVVDRFPAGSQERSNHLRRMRAIGIDTTPYDVNSPTYKDIKDASDELGSRRMESLRGIKTHESSGIDYADIIFSAVSGDAFSDKGRQFKLDLLSNYLKTGNTELLHHQLANAAYQSMEPSTKKEVLAGRDAISQIQTIESVISEFKLDAEFGGKWKNALESGKKWFEITDRDDALFELRSKIQLLQSPIRNELFGAALSPQEAFLAEDFLVDFKADEIGDILIKMDTLKSKFGEARGARYDMWLGASGIFGSLGVDNFIYERGHSLSGQNALDYFDNTGAIFNDFPVADNLLTTMAYGHMKKEGYANDPNAISITKNNNPGALKWDDPQVAFGGEEDDHSPYTIFPTPSDGFRALMADLKGKITGNTKHMKDILDPTIKDYIKVYSATEQGSYVKFIVNYLNKNGYPNINENTSLSSLIPLLSQ